MSGTVTRPQNVWDATVTGRHRELAARNATPDDIVYDYDGPYLGAFLIAIIGLVAACGIGSEQGTSTGFTIGVAAAAAATFTFWRVRLAERNHALARYACGLAYLEAMRGKTLDVELATFYDGSVSRLADAVAGVAHHVGVDRAHQLLVVAQRDHDYELFARLNAASISRTGRSTTWNQRRGDCYVAVVNKILSSREPVGTVLEIERMLDAVDANRVAAYRVDMAL